MSLQLLNPNEIISLEKLAELYNELRESHSNLWNELLKARYEADQSPTTKPKTEQDNLRLHLDRERSLSMNRHHTTCSLSLTLYNSQKENQKLVQDNVNLEQQVQQLKQELEQKEKLLIENQINLENSETLLKSCEEKCAQLTKELKTKQQQRPLVEIKPKQTKIVQQPIKNRMELLNLDESYLQEQRELELETIRKNLSMVSFSEFETQQKLESVLSGNDLLRVLYSGQIFKDWKNYLKLKSTSTKANNENCYLNEYMSLIQQNVKILIDCLVMYKLEFSTLSISGTQFVYVDYYNSENYEKDLFSCCDRFIQHLKNTLKTEPTPEFSNVVYQAIRKAAQFSEISPNPKSLDKHVTWSVTLEQNHNKQSSVPTPITTPVVYRLLFLNSERIHISNNLLSLYK